jgi:hypothetical protein
MLQFLFELNSSPSAKSNFHVCAFWTYLQGIETNNEAPTGTFPPTDEPTIAINTESPTAEPTVAAAVAQYTASPTVNCGCIPDDGGGGDDGVTNDDDKNDDDRSNS